MSTKRPPKAAPVDPGIVLFGKTRRLVLGWLYGHPEEEFYLREIVRRTGAALGAAQRELDALVRAGLVTRRAHGRQVYYRAERGSPIFAELRSIFEKTSGLVEVLRESLRPLAGRIRLAFVFGSAARGELASGSDVDVLIVGDAAFDEVADALAAAQARLGRDVNPTVYPQREFDAKREARHHFLTSVLCEPRLLVIGDSDELDGLGAERMGTATPKRRRGDSRPSRGHRPRPGR